MAKKYRPPIQGRAGQIIDCVFVLGLVYVALLLPLLLGGGANEVRVEGASDNPTWESLGQNQTMQAQWEKLGLNEKEAGEMINTRFDYTIDPIALIITALVIVGYFVFLLKVSDKEYKEVISEVFDKDDGQERDTGPTAS